jgi:hypothetical protein
VRDAKKKGT